jgi:hypothetical protein
MHSYSAYLNNPILNWLWRHGYELPVDPAGPLSGPSPIPWKFGPHPEPWRAGPRPEPWRTAVGEIVQAVQARDLASRITDEKVREQIIGTATATISAVLDDDLCPPYRRWPWPGPPPWPWLAVSELTSLANALPAGGVHDQLKDVAAQILERAATTVR